LTTAGAVAATASAYEAGSVPTAERRGCPGGRRPGNRYTIRNAAARPTVADWKKNLAAVEKLGIDMGRAAAERDIIGVRARRRPCPGPAVR